MHHGRWRRWHCSRSLTGTILPPATTQSRSSLLSVVAVVHAYTPHSRLPHGLRGCAWLHCLTMRLCHRRSVQDRISVTPCPVSHVFLGPSTTDHHVLHLSLCLHCMRICLPEIWGTSQWSLRCAQKGTGPGQWQFKHKPSPS